MTPGAGEPCWWNLDIAATALQDWSTARRAWRAFGLSVPDGTGPMVMELGDVPIRLKPDGEVVWCVRIDPARARIMNIPLPGTIHRYRDILLHDGAASGHRVIDGVEIPVFNELTVLEPSAFRTHVVAMRCAGPADTEALQRITEGAGGACEDWTKSWVPLCKNCSDGTPHEHTAQPDLPWQADRTCGIAVPPGSDPRTILADWLRDDPSRHAQIDDASTMIGP